uniref:Uncharacterized protein n=1 Tax=Oryza meridionalis TaxID=40149 RepID=A0A0E0CXB7_9ORYZ
MLGLVATGITGGALAQVALAKAAKPIKLGPPPEVLHAAAAAGGGGDKGEGGEAAAGTGCWLGVMNRGI